MLRYKTETRPGLVTLYDIRTGNGACPFLQPRSPHGTGYNRLTMIDFITSHWITADHPVRTSVLRQDLQNAYGILHNDQT